MPDTTVEVEDDTVVEVEIEGTPAEGTEPPKPPAPPVQAAEAPEPKPAKPASAADEAAAALTQSLEQQKRQTTAALATAEAERRRADNAARMAADADRRAREATDEISTGKLTLITNKIDAATKDLEAAKSEYESAYDAGDSKRIIAANIRMSDAMAEIKVQTNRKQDLEAAAARQPADQRPGQVDDGARTPEMFIQRGNFAPAAQAWLRARPDVVPADYGGDATKHDQLMAGHYEAASKKIPFNSPQYFEILETHLGERASAAEEPAPPPPRPVPKPAQRNLMPSAPPSREPPTPSGAPTGKQSVKLNAAQQEAALFSYPAKPGEDESAHRKRAFGTYASEYVKAVAEGKIGRLTH
jgi:hypothetical protein